MSTVDPTLEKLTREEYKYGFVTDIEQDSVPPGLSEAVVRLISEKKNEPEWLLAFRLKALSGVSKNSWRASPSPAGR